jgi:hypothetical protein
MKEYKLDNFNRLVVRTRGKNVSACPRFKVEKDSSLTCWLNEPDAWRRKNNLPGKINFQGNWRLDADHNLELDLSRSKSLSQQGRLVLKGRIISLASSYLVFEMETVDKDGLSHFQLLKLSGVWQADEYNRLCLEVGKKDEPDALILQGSWDINRNQQIIYKYEKADLRTKTKSVQSLTFKGYWQIDEADRLAYILSGGPQSRFDFRAQLESPNIYPEQGKIKYRLGAGLRGGGARRARVITLYGDWKFSRKGNLNFQMDYGSRGLESIEFGAGIHLTKRDEITLALTNRMNEPLGINIVLSRKFLKNPGAQVFLRLKSLKPEFRVEAGVKAAF